MTSGQASGYILDGAAPPQKPSTSFTCHAFLLPPMASSLNNQPDGVVLYSSEKIRLYVGPFSLPLASFCSHCLWCFDQSSTMAGECVAALEILGVSIFLRFKSVTRGTSQLTAHITQFVWLLTATFRCNCLAIKKASAARAHPRYLSTHRATVEFIEAVR